MSLSEIREKVKAGEEVQCPECKTGKIRSRNGSLGFLECTECDCKIITTKRITI